MKKIYAILLFIIILFSVLFRFYKLGEIPGGLYIDEASQGYNAYSLLLTGKDRYGQSFPIMFRQFGSFQAPIYTYLTILPVKILGLNIFSVRFISALTGVISVILTYLIISKTNLKKNKILALTASFIMAFVPWSISFSRYATEANLGFGIFLSGILFLYLSLQNIKLFPIAAILFSLSTHAYYSERVIAPLVLIIFSIVFLKRIIKYKKWIIIGFILFALVQLPHVITLKEGAFTRRLDEVSYLDSRAYNLYGVKFHNLPFGRILYVSREFISQYSAYYSPRNLFFDPDPQEARSIPNLSVFYFWMIVPFIFGFRSLLKNSSNNFNKLIIILLAVAPLPAALSGDPFYTLRAVELLWAFTIIITLGVLEISYFLKNKYIQITVFTFLIIYSLLKLYISYFVFFNYERADVYQYTTKKLVEKTAELKNDQFVIDTTRNYTIGVIHAFFRAYEPQKIQAVFGDKLATGYYTNNDFVEPYFFDNLEIRPFNWEEDNCRNLILVGDTLAISPGQVKEHELKLEFEITDKIGNVVIRGFRTNPEKKCKVN